MAKTKVCVVVPDPYELSRDKAIELSLRLVANQGFREVELVSTGRNDYPLGGGALEVLVQGEPPDGFGERLGTPTQTMPPPDLFPEKFTLSDNL